jgi:hypothetical protein
MKHIQAFPLPRGTGCLSAQTGEEPLHILLVWVLQGAILLSIDLEDF